MKPIRMYRRTKYNTKDKFEILLRMKRQADYGRPHALSHIGSNAQAEMIMWARRLNPASGALYCWEGSSSFRDGCYDEAIIG